MSVNADAWDERLYRSDRNAFDVVRLALATLVVFEHSYFLIDGTAERDPLSILSGGQTNCGQFAVFMFFVLSGFLVTGSLLESSSTREFIAKRVARIVPGFLVATMLACLILGPLASPSTGQFFRSQNWRNIIIEALALKQVGVTGILESNHLQLIHGTLWTIKYEFDCYLLLALLGALGLMRSSIRILTFAILATASAVAMAVGLPIVDHGIIALVISSPNRWPELFPFFFMGSAFFVFRKHIPKSIGIFVLSLLAIVTSLAGGAAYWALLFGGTYAVLFAALSFSAQIKLFGRRVDLSYGVYLYGWPIQQMILFYGGMQLLPMELFAVSLFLSCLAAWASWTIVERPSLQLVRKHRPLRSCSPAS